MDDFQLGGHSLRLHGAADIPQVLDACGSEQLRFNLMETSFFVRPADDRSWARRRG